MKAPAQAQKTVAVIGAGPAGLTAAYQLARRKVAVHVFEAGPAVGGLSRTIDLWNQKVDLGPHRFFSNDSRVNKLWLELMGADYEMVERLTRIYYKGRFFHYPLKPLDALLKLGPIEAVRCFSSFILEKVRESKTGDSFEDWVVTRFGRRLFEIFFKTYSEKLWGISCRELDSDFAAQRIKKLSLLEAIKNAFFKGGTHKTLVDQFAYPHGGTGELYTRMAAYVVAHGGSVQCDTPVQRVLTSDGRVIALELQNGERREFDEIISTMPLTQLVARLPDAPEAVKQSAASLKFRNTVLVYLKIEAQGLFGDNWLYVHSPELRVGRITNFRNWVPQLVGREKSTILALEYWCDSDEQEWTQPSEAWIALARRELAQTGLLGGAPVSAGHVHRISRCYPVYTRGYKESLAPVERYLDTIHGLSVIGRYGSFKYNNQDHSILMGMLAAENIADAAGHNLWEINTDYEDYQEASVITRTGLVQKPAPELLPAGIPVLQRA